VSLLSVAAVAQLNPDGVSSFRHGGLACCGYPVATAEFDRDLAQPSAPRSVAVL
jgi:hypothetical protein